jgi:hypothetical protein
MSPNVRSNSERRARRSWHLLALTVPLLVAHGAAAVRDQAIAPSVAALFVGEPHVVEGTVTGAARDGTVVRLRFGEGPQDLTVSLVIGLLSDFPPDPEHYYPGKTVRVSGRVRSFRGAPEIVVRDVADIRVVDLDHPGLAANSPAAESSLRTLVETLSDRVRHLEEQLRSLNATPAGR